MSKLTLQDVSSLQNESTAITQLKQNNDATEAAVENTLSRDGTSPNQMLSNLDMNNYKIINLPDALTDQEPATYSQLTSGLTAIGNGAVIDAAYVTLDNNANLLSNRVLTGGNNVSVTDQGAKGFAVVDVSDNELLALASTTAASDTVPYYTGTTTASTTSLTPFARTVIAGADAPTVRTTIGLGNVDNTSDATKNAATATLTNKTIDTAGPNTIKINGNTLAASAGTATVTIPNSTDTLVGQNTTDTLANKTLTTPVINGVSTGTGVSTGITANTLGLRDGSAILWATNFHEGSTSTVTAAGTTTLSVNSSGIQYFTGTTTQTVKLPTTNVPTSHVVTIFNKSTGLVTVQSSNGTTIVVMGSNTMAYFTSLVSPPVLGTDWSFQYFAINTASGKVATINNNLTFAGTDGTTQTFQASDTIVGRATTDTLTNKTISGASNTLSNIGNAALTNSTITVGSTSTALGGTLSAATGRGPNALNIDQATGHGDSNYTILSTDRHVFTNAAFTAPRTWTLPAANSVNAGQRILIGDLQGTVSSTNTLFIAPNGTDTINGTSGITLSTASTSLEVVSDGTSKWYAVQSGSGGGGGGGAGSVAKSYEFSATAGQTSFSGTDQNSKTLSYTVGNVQVYINGIRQNIADFTATNGSTVTLAVGAKNAGDLVTIVDYGSGGGSSFASYEYTSSAGQTTFSGTDINGKTLAYTAGFVLVSINGDLLNKADYTATNGTSVVFSVGRALNDQVTIIAMNQSSVALIPSNNLSDVASKTTANANLFIAPTIQRFTSGTAATYTTPASCQWIRVRMVGGGGGGSGGGSSAANGGAGSASTWSGGSLSAGGGAAGQADSGANAPGGTATGGNVLNVNGGAGAAGASNFAVGGMGGSSYFGGAGGNSSNGVGGAAAANSGGGGGGGGTTGTTISGSGGGAGAYVEHIITSPASTYTYTVGTAGSAGTAGTGGSTGGAGAAGLIIVEEYYGT